jgi:two-component system, NarL family, nitrate/nitrite response regulator NarL
MGTGLTNKIKLFLIDDHAMFREALSRLFEDEPSIEIVGQGSSALEALPMLKKTGTTMVLLDVDLGNEKALDFVVEARKVGFAGQILVLTAGLNGPMAVQLIQAGIAGILHKQHSSETLRHTIMQVAQGQVFLEKDYLGSLFLSVDRTRTSAKPLLAEREKALIRYLFEGMTNKEIGLNLQMSEGAVKASLHQLFEKTGARTRAQLVKVALEQYREQL